MMKPTVIGNCEIYLGNCMELLETIAPGSVDLCWSDPPYGVRYLANSRKVLEIPEMLANDEKPHTEYVAPIVRCVKDGGAVYLCTRFDVAQPWVEALKDAGAKVKNPIFWIKDLGSQGDLAGDRSSAVEIVLFCAVGRHLLRGKRTNNAWMIPRPDVLLHPTPKPIELIRRCILASSDPGDLVLDPFVGSGSTAVACAQTGRRCICCEISPVYFDLACERIEKACRDVGNRLPGFDPVALEQQQLF